MDGRINIPIATALCLASSSPFRNLGASFDLGVAAPGRGGLALRPRPVRSGQRVLSMFITYHYSRASPIAAAAGFNYHTDQAIAHVFGVKGRWSTCSGAGMPRCIPWSGGWLLNRRVMVLHGRRRNPGCAPPWAPTKPGQFASQTAASGHAGMCCRSGLAVVEMPPTWPRCKLDRQLDIEHREGLFRPARGFDFPHAPTWR